MAYSSTSTRGYVGLAVAAIIGLPSLASGQCVTATLDAMSVFTRRQCLPPCACVIAPQVGPLTGSLTACFDHTDGQTEYFNVTADLTGTPTSGPSAHLTGTGVFTLGPSSQELTLDLAPDGGSSLHYDSGQVALSALTLPSIAITVQTAIQGCTQYTLAINAVASCRADFNNDGRVTVQDIFDFLAAWFAGSSSADFNGSGAVTVQDIFDFLAAWFAGCS